VTIALVSTCAYAASAGAEGEETASTLARPEAPVVLQQNEPASNGRATSASPTTPPAFNVTLPDQLRGIAPSDLVAFRWDGGWSQVPVQVDEREMMTLNRIYNGGYPGCSDPCYNPPTTAASQQLVRHLNYTDAGTWVGPDTDPTLDGDDEIALMARDAGGRASTEFAPSGVSSDSAVEVKIADPLDGGEGYVYLFESTDGLDPAAGASYVDYDFELDNAPYKTGAYAHTTFPTRAAENGKSMRYGPRPETSEVRTENYVRRFRDRWLDDDIEVHRGGATGVDILDRHDAQFDTLDASCVRTQATYRAGEGAFVINKSGPVRALRDFIGANSGPHVQRQHVFYDAKEVINTHLRVHAVPGVTDFFDYSTAGIGLTYSSGVAGIGAVNSGIRIDGVPDPFVPFVGTSGVDGWEAVDGPQGGLTMPQRFVTNNSDPSYHGNYRDGLFDGKSCNGDGRILGASGPQGNSAFESTDEAAGATKHLFYERVIYYEAPGQADGPKRLAEEQNPLELTATPVALRAAEPETNSPPSASFAVSPASPRPGKPVTFTSTSADADGAITQQEWDLDGDGQFDDSSGPQASRTFAEAGVYPVSLRVTDDDGATAETTRSIAVCPSRNGPPGCRG
jgi:hypothetical protein